jgi:hypothetical protein
MLEKILVTDETLFSAKFIEDSPDTIDIANLFQLRPPENVDNFDPVKFDFREAKIKRLFEIFMDALKDDNNINGDFDILNFYLCMFYESELNLKKALNHYDDCIKNDLYGLPVYLWGKVRVLLQLGKRSDAFKIIQNELDHPIESWDIGRKATWLVNEMVEMFFRSLRSDDPMLQYDMSGVSKRLIDILTEKDIQPRLG